MLRRCRLGSFSTVASRLHDLVGDPRQTGVAGACVGVKAVARQDLAAGTVVFRECGPTSSRASVHSIQIDVEKHCEVTGEGRFCIHAAEPTCYIRIHSPQDVAFVARVDCPVGADLSINYEATEWELTAPFVDYRTGVTCRGFKHLSEDQRRYLHGLGILPSHILRLWGALETSPS